MEESESMKFEDKINLIFRGDRDDKINDFLAKFGLGPNYVPTPPKTYECPCCKNHNAVFEEVHPDTDMNEILLRCPDCGYSGDKPS